MRLLRIMVVEDEVYLAVLFAEVLGAMGHDVCAIESTQANAVAAAARCQPDLMIVDIGLGDGSGMIAVDEILLTGFVPHVFVSGDITAVQTLRPNAVAIQKPFFVAALNLAMQRALGIKTALESAGEEMAKIGPHLI